MLAETPSPHGSGASRVTVGTLSEGIGQRVTLLPYLVGYCRWNNRSGPYNLPDNQPCDLVSQCFFLTAPFRTRFSPCEMARTAHVQRLRGCLYILWYCYIPPCRFSRHSFSWNQRRTRSPLAAPALCVTRSAKWRSRCPSANTRKPLRWRARDNRVWNWERKALRTGEAMATSVPGSLLIAWRRQLPKRAPGNSVRILLVVLSKPSVRMPRTRYNGSCWSAAC